MVIQSDLIMLRVRFVSCRFLDLSVFFVFVVAEHLHLQIGRVKLAGNSPCRPVASLIPISHPSSCSDNQRQQQKAVNALGSVAYTETISKYLFFRIFVFNHLDHVANFQRQFILVFRLIPIYPELDELIEMNLFKYN